MTTLTLRVRTNPGDTTSPSELTMEQVDDNFISLKNGVSTAEQNITNISQQFINNDPISMAIALG